MKTGLNETEATHLITSLELLPKVVKSLPQINSITHIVYMETPGSDERPDPIQGINLHSWTQLYEMGDQATHGLHGETPTGDDIAILMYTSGSTGTPKGVMITHRNIVTTAKGFASLIVTRDVSSMIAWLKSELYKSFILFSVKNLPKSIFFFHGRARKQRSVSSRTYRWRMFWSWLLNR